ncbi:diaminopimelate epimerase [Candidatus Dependentiae bacterium]|nr:diaminopimelate epimerase [Candidatus Dependentiae bacterium]
MFTKFYKYQSLGNDFIIFDYFNQNSKLILNEIKKINFANFIKKICNRNFGIGADCVLVIINNKEKQLPEIFIFNANGSSAKICLNGLRCCCLHLFQKYSFKSIFEIKMFDQITNCKINEKNLEITNIINKGNYIHQKSIHTKKQIFSGHMIDVGNPHLIIFKKTNLEWLKKNAQSITTYNEFEEINIELVWQNQKNNKFNMLIYERGCGITLACSSGCAALTNTLFHLSKIKQNEKINICMLGGNVLAWIDKKNKINLRAKAYSVFKGTLY